MFKTLSGKELYRIGDCIISVNAKNPSSNFGGTWELLCPGRTLVCVDTSQSEFNALKKTGGSKYMQKHSHTSIESGGHTPSGTITSHDGHWHDLYNRSVIKNGTGGTYTTLGFISDHNANGSSTQKGGAHTHDFVGKYVSAHTHTINSTGEGQSQNLQPFMAVYIWVRVA